MPSLHFLSKLIRCMLSDSITIMVKTTRVADTNEDSSKKKYRGVRKRKWGKYVSEIRLPNSRERIWLGSYDTPEKAARAFDAASYCLRGAAARFNFPGSPPLIENGRAMPPAEIQAAAARFAHGGDSGRVGSVGLGSESPLPSESPSCGFVGEGLGCVSVMPEMPLGSGVFDQLGVGKDLGLFPEFNEYVGDYSIVASPDNYWEDYNNNNYYCEEINAGLWNFER